MRSSGPSFPPSPTGRAPLGLHGASEASLGEGRVVKVGGDERLRAAILARAFGALWYGLDGVDNF